MFYGWGGNSVTEQLDETRALVLQYRYFHIFWLLRFSWGLKYSLATATADGWATRPLSDQEVDELQARERLTVNPWKRWSLPAAIGLLVLGGMLGNML